MEYLLDLLSPQSLLGLLQTLAAFIAAVFILVAIHEYGHYLVARLCGVHVHRFSVGFGWPLCVWRPRRTPEQEAAGLAATEFTLAAIPLGGYVKMLDEREAPVPAHQQQLAFTSKPPLQRIAIAAAGPLANFILAILAYWIIFTLGVARVAPEIGKVDPGSQAALAGLRAGQVVVAVDDRAVSSWRAVNMRLVDRLGDTGVIRFSVREPDSTEPSLFKVHVEDWLATEQEPQLLRSLGIHTQLLPPLLGAVTPGSPAEAAGLQVGDLITAVNGQPVEEWRIVVAYLQASPETPLLLDVSRGGGRRQVTLVPGRHKLGDGAVIGFAGIMAEETKHMVRVSIPVHWAWLPAVQQTWDLSIFTFEAIGKMLTGQISPTNLSGPITIAKYAGDTAKSGLESFLGFLAILSISLAVINLLPIPVLDGGHILYYTIELLTGRPLPERVQTWGLQLGLALILGIMGLAIYFDIERF